MTPGCDLLSIATTSLAPRRGVVVRSGVTIEPSSRGGPRVWSPRGTENTPTSSASASLATWPSVGSHKQWPIRDYLGRSRGGTTRRIVWTWDSAYRTRYSWVSRLFRPQASQLRALPPRPDRPAIPFPAICRARAMAFRPTSATAPFASALARKPRDEIDGPQSTVVRSGIAANAPVSPCLPALPRKSPASSTLPS